MTERGKYVAPGRAHGHQHGEAFCRMKYECEWSSCGRIEWIWNSRDGVTPFIVNCPNCRGPMKHADWFLDRYEPTHTPSPGERFFRDGTPDEARAFMRARLEKCKGTEYEVTDPAEAEAIIERAATSADGEFRPGWPMLDVVPSEELTRSDRHVAAVKHAIRLLRWWAAEATDAPIVVEMIEQSKECADELEATSGE